MAELALSNGGVTLVDDDMLDSLSRFTWFGHSGGRGGGRYAKARVLPRFGGNKGSHTLLHRFIMRAPDGFVVDHINGDTLDNRRENLQIITQSRNCMKGRNAIGRGVCFDNTAYRWRATIRVDGKRYYLGHFDTEAEARATVELHRKVAWEESEINVLGAQLAPENKP